ncbi:hypothetical protein [Paenibacillus taichungensis]|uniref:hypothetical protein n=1 Tax=Paenibacillus taichungensis TaxID=484184 RepID=UPI003D9A71A6
MKRVEVPYSHTGETNIINPEVMQDVTKYLWGDAEINSGSITTLGEKLGKNKPLCPTYIGLFLL